MSLHPSLKVDTATASQRSVLTRIERIKDLMKKGLWSETQSITGLPKTKIIRLKAMKTKTKEEDTATEAGTAAATGQEAKTATKEAKPSAKEAAKPAKEAKDSGAKK